MLSLFFDVKITDLNNGVTTEHVAAPALVKYGVTMKQRNEALLDLHCKRLCIVFYYNSIVSLPCAHWLKEKTDIQIILRKQDKFYKKNFKRKNNPSFRPVLYQTIPNLRFTAQTTKRN